ncbi:hypothetical protein QE152_g22087 [Popillia japonica]|uniref:Uncharacterized protein n=1 Tax=Popillia japonica TaxID=7064 RepID=A0AAW1KLB6_POPJA
MIEGACQWYWTKISEIHTWQDFRNNFKKTFFKEKNMNWTKISEIHTWQDFRNNFKKTFFKEKNMTSKWKKMTERTERNMEKGWNCITMKK